MRVLTRIKKSIKYRLRYFLFSTLQVPSTSFRSLIFEFLVLKLDSKLFKLHDVRMSLSLKPDGDEDIFKDESFSIIYHGKIIDWNYLRENLTRMRKSCPDSPMVLSTYSRDITPEIISVCELNNISLLGIDEPDQLLPPFAGNFIRGVSSAFAGISLANEMGAVWGMKIRVDQDVSRKSGLKFVSHLLQGGILDVDNSRRLIGTSYNSYSSLPIFLSDMLHFGKLESLLEYWKPIEIARISELTDEIFADSDVDLCKWKFVPEVWLAARYMYSLKVPALSIEQANQSFWREFGGVVDSTTLGQNWLKTLDAYDSNYASIKWFEESYSKQYLEFHFADWVRKVLD